MKKGAPKPDISTPEAVKKLLLAAKSISSPDASTGAAAGVSINNMLKKLGIDEQIEPKLRRVKGKGPGGAGGGDVAMAMVADGEVEIGMTFLSEMNDPGIDRVGALPREISPRTTLVGFVSTHAKNPDAAKALLQNRDSYPARIFRNSLRLLLIVPIIATLDAAAFAGTISWLLRDKLRLAPTGHDDDSGE